MKVKIQDIREKIETVLASKGYSAGQIESVIEMYLGGELSGHASHGLANFASFASKDYSNLEKPTVIKETDALFMIDAKSNPGIFIGKTAADEAIKRAKKEVIGVSLIKNMESWPRPGAVAQYIADKGYLAIVMNDGGGRSIAPPGGFEATLGTNPIAYGIPTAEASLVVDMATSKRAWGQVRLANKYGTDLPADTFYDDQGKLTLDPKNVESVLPFGDYKGYALALLIEVLCGSLVGKAMMIVSTEGSNFGAKFPDRGGLILVIDPSQTVGLEQFKQQNSEMIEIIKSTKPLPGKTIRIPGEQGSELERGSINSGEIELPDELWQELQAL